MENLTQFSDLPPFEERYAVACVDYWKICWDELDPRIKDDIRVFAIFEIVMLGHSKLHIEHYLSRKIQSPHLPEAIKYYNQLSNRGKELVMGVITQYSNILP